jgi:hypothetical protein
MDEVREEEACTGEGVTQTHQIRTACKDNTLDEGLSANTTRAKKKNTVGVMNNRTYLNNATRRSNEDRFQTHVSENGEAVALTGRTERSIRSFFLPPRDIVDERGKSCPISCSDCYKDACYNTYLSIYLETRAWALLWYETNIVLPLFDNKLLTLLRA